MLAACLPVIISGTTRGRAAYDSLNYHEKAIRQFAQELPNPNLKDYLSATTPGYHLALATAARVGGVLHPGGPSAYEIDLTPTPPDPMLEGQRRRLQGLGLLFTLGLLYLVGHWSQRRLTVGGSEPGPALAAVCLAMPLIGSPYIYQSAAWLLPDNSAWLGVTAILLIALRPRIGAGAVIAMGAVLLWLVLARQVHLWAAGVVWAAAWVSSSLPADRTHGPLLARADLLNAGTARAIAQRVGFAIVCTLPAVLLLVWFWSLWNRHLVPPTFIAWHSAGIQGATPAFLLSLIALVAPFFGAWLARAGTLAWRDHRGWLLAGGAVGFLLAVVPPSAWDFDNGRFGGIWSLYQRAGEIGGRSLALAVLAPAGAAVVVIALAGVPVRQRWVLLGALAGFAAANSANPQLWQRYHEPFVLLWLIVACALAAQHDVAPQSGPGRTWRLAGPAMLAAVLAAVNAALILRTPPQTDEHYRPGHIETPPRLVPPGERPN